MPDVLWLFDIFDSLFFLQPVFLTAARVPGLLGKIGSLLLFFRVVKSSQVPIAKNVFLEPGVFPYHDVVPLMDSLHPQHGSHSLNTRVTSDRETKSVLRVVARWLGTLALVPTLVRINPKLFLERYLSQGSSVVSIVGKYL